MGKAKLEREIVNLKQMIWAMVYDNGGVVRISPKAILACGQPNAMLAIQPDPQTKEYKVEAYFDVKKGGTIDVVQN